MAVLLNIYREKMGEFQILENSFGGGHALFAGIDLAGFAKRDPKGLEDRFDLVVCIFASFKVKVEGYPSFVDKGFEEFFQHFSI